MIHEGDLPRRLPRYCVEDTDRHGNVRVYVRLRGKLEGKIRIQGSPWSDDFMRRYERALAGLPPDPEEKQLRSHAAGTWGWLCQQYFAAPDFLHLSEGFQITRRAILEATFTEPMKPGSALVFADCPLGSMTKAHIRTLRDRKLDVPFAADNRLKAIRKVYSFGLEVHETWVPSNPARDVPYFNQGSDGYYTWSIPDVLQYLDRHGPGTMARRALCVLLFTGVRRSNAVGLGRQFVTTAGSLRFQIHKRRRTDKPKWLEIPILPELAFELTQGKQRGLMWLVTTYGKPFTANGFGNWFKKRCREARLPQCSAHGLRKAGATIAAENGATDAQLMAIFGWETVKQAAEYRKKAEQRLLALSAMRLISIPTWGEKVPPLSPVGQITEKIQQNQS